MSDNNRNSWVRSNLYKLIPLSLGSGQWVQHLQLRLVLTRFYRYRNRRDKRSIAGRQ